MGSYERIRRGLGRAVLGIGCIYEVAALLTELPTITEMIKKMGEHNPAGRLVVWAWCGYIAWHFLEPVTEVTD